MSGYVRETAAGFALARQMATPPTTKAVEQMSAEVISSPCSGAASSRLMTSVRLPNGASIDCGANANEAMSIRPHDMPITMPTTLSARRPRWAAQRCRLRLAAFVVAARHASSTPIAVAGTSGAGGAGGSEIHDLKPESGLGEKLQDSSSPVPAPRRRSSVCRRR